MEDIVVFIADEMILGDSLWKLGRVTRLIPSQVDGIVRSVILEYKNFTEDVFRDTKRSVRKIAIIHREGDLYLMDMLNDAAMINDVKHAVELQYDTVHSRLRMEFINRGDEDEDQEDTL